MKRLMAAIIDVFICFILMSIFRFSLATVQKILLNIHGIYRSAMFYLTDLWIVVIFLSVLVCYFTFSGRKGGISIGKKIMGIKVKEKRGNLSNVLHILFRIVAITLSPLTLIYYLVIGEMPYDRILKINVIDKNKNLFSKRNSALKVNIFICIILISIFLYKYSELCRKIIYFYLILPLISIILIGDIAGLYIAAIDLPIQNIGEEVLLHGKGGDVCEFIFSEQGEENAWALIITNEEEYRKECVINGYGLEELKKFDFSSNFLVCTYGRKLDSVRVLAGQYEKELPPFLELKHEYERNMVYYYCIPRIDVEYKEEDICNQGPKITLIIEEDVNYLMLRKPPLIEIKGPLERWIWAIRCRIKMLKDPYLREINGTITNQFT